MKNRSLQLNYELLVRLCPMICDQRDKVLQYRYATVEAIERFATIMIDIERPIGNRNFVFRPLQR